MVGLVVSVLLVVHQQMINDLSNQKCEIQHHTKESFGFFEDSSTTKKTISTIVIAGKIVLLTSLDILVELS